MSQESTIHLTEHRIKARLSMVGDLRAKFEGFLLELGLSDTEKDIWKLCFSEAVFNSVEHGSNTEEDPIVVRWWTQNATLYLEVQDVGTGEMVPDYENAKLPDDPLEEGGRGLYILKSNVDKISYLKGADRFCLRLEKKYEYLNSVIPQHSEMEAILDELSDSYESLSLFDRMAENLLEDERVDGFVESGLELFMDSRDYDGICFLVRDTKAAPEYKWIAEIQSDHIFGPLKSKIWELIEERESITWSPQNSESNPFETTDKSSYANGGAVPVYVEEQVVGLIAVGYFTPKQIIRSNDIRNLRALADIIGISLSRALIERERDERKRLEVEINVATKLQHQLLPLSKQPPSIDGYDLFYTSHSALEVAGDYVEVRQNIDGQYIGCVIDVMGKGVSAAILAGIFRSQFIGYSLRSSVSLSKFLERCNQALEIQLGDVTMFITAYVFRLDPKTHEFSYAAAGHPPALLFREGETTRELASSGPPIGLFETMEYSEQSIQLQPKDRIIIVTDGLYEWTAGDSKFGWEEMVEWFEANKDDSAKAIWDKMNKKMVAARTEMNLHQEDDETLLILTQKPA